MCFSCYQNSRTKDSSCLAPSRPLVATIGKSKTLSGALPAGEPGLSKGWAPKEDWERRAAKERCVWQWQRPQPRQKRSLRMFPTASVYLIAWQVVGPASCGTVFTHSNQGVTGIQHDPYFTTLTSPLPFSSCSYSFPGDFTLKYPFHHSVHRPYTQYLVLISKATVTPWTHLAASPIECPLTLQPLPLPYLIAYLHPNVILYACVCPSIPATRGVLRVGWMDALVLVHISSAPPRSSRRSCLSSPQHHKFLTHRLSCS